MNKQNLKRKLPVIIAASLIVIGAILVIAFFVMRVSYPFEGKGTKSSPYLISTKSDLIDFMELSQKTNSTHKGKYFRLAADIDLEDTEWTPFGYKSQPFGGSFDGGGYTVKNFTIKAAGKDVGFFSGTKNSFADSGIYNLTLDNVSLISDADKNYLGILVGHAKSIIQNCVVKGNMQISGNPNGVGGIAGYSEGAIRNCQSEGMMSVLAAERVGKDKVSLQWSNIGGIAGSAYGDITDSSNSMSISMTRKETDGELSRSHHIGGIVGCAGGELYSNLTNYADLRTVGGLGGIIGTINEGKAVVEKCFNYGSLYSISDVLLDVGGIVCRSFQESQPKIINCENQGDIVMESLLKTNKDGSYSVISCWGGGILGLGKVNIYNCAQRGNISANGVVTHYLGGIAGGIAGEVKNSYNHGNITAYSQRGSVIVGGIVGILQSHSNAGVFSSYSAGFLAINLGEHSLVPANYMAGGVIGYNMTDANPIQNNHYDSDKAAAYQAPEGFWGALNWYGEETPGEAENIDAPHVFGNSGLSTFLMQTTELEGFVKFSQNADDVDAVWVFADGEYPRLFWQ